MHAPRGAWPVVVGFLLLASPGFAQVTERVNVSSSEAEANVGGGPSTMSADGRYVSFISLSSNLVPGDVNGLQDAFVRDRQLGTTELVSVSTGGVQANGEVFRVEPVISDDGRFVAFSSAATNLVAGDVNGKRDIFVRDRQLGTTELVSVTSGGVQGNGDSGTSILQPSLAMSADGRFVAFGSVSTNLVAGDTNAVLDVFLRDRQLGTTERVSLSNGGAQAAAECVLDAMTPDGRYVVFSSMSTLVAGDSNLVFDVFVRDRQLGTTVRASVATNGLEANSASYDGSISADGSRVAFMSHATNLGAATTFVGIFVRDFQGPTTEYISLSPAAAVANGASMDPAISADGRYVAFASEATNLVAGDPGPWSDVFVRDLVADSTEFASLATGGAQSNGESGGFEPSISISSNGRFVAFRSNADNLVAGDTNLADDVFLRDRDATGFTSICHPGVGGVQSCPCSNPPSATGRGCNNSAATGGARLAAAGVAYLSADSLVFTTTGEKPTALSTVWQGPATPPAGILFGQGVRCASGSLKRLYNKSAVGGSITAPNFGAGDPTVSARSATLGAPISAGQARYYFVSYRDPVVLGGCPATNTFNDTQTGRVLWSL